MVVAERYLQRLKRRIAKASDAKKRVGFGTIAALIGGVVGPYGNVCWSILIVGDCFERGSMASLVGGAFIGAMAGAFLGPEIFRPEKRD